MKKKILFIFALLCTVVQAAWADNVELSGSYNYTVNDGDVLTGETNGTVTIAAGAKITLYDATINGGIVCAGTAEITLFGFNSVTGRENKAGIQVGGKGTTLIINGDGSLTTTGGSGGAGIGTGHASEGSAEFGNITINGGGSLTATGGERAAGIGTGETLNGSSVSLGDITINGGWVTATGRDVAGIGTGNATGNTEKSKVSIGNITINGGTVTATGSNTTAGIGTSYTVYSDVSIGNITINGGTVTAKSYEGVGIGTGFTEHSDVSIGDVTIFTSADMLYASSITVDVIYMNGEDNVTGNPTDYFIFTLGDSYCVISGNYTAVDGDVLTGSTNGTVTIADGDKITLNGVTINGGIVCEGDAEITLTGTNSVTAPDNKAGIQVGGEGTTLTIKGDGSLAATGGEGAAGIGLSSAVSDCTGGHIVIEGGTITATGGQFGAGIGTCYANNVNVALGDITFKGCTVTATGSNGGAGIGTGATYLSGTGTIGAVKVYVGVDMLYASSISKDITYMNDEHDVTAMASDFFDITVDDGHYVIVTKQAVILADGTAFDGIYDHLVCSITYRKTLGEERVGKYQTWFVPFDYTITSGDEDAFTFYKINMIANSPDPSQNATDDIWVFLKKLEAGDVLHGNMPYVYKPKQAVTDYAFTTLNTTLKAKANDARITMMTAEETYTVFGTYEDITATALDPFYYVNINGDLSLGNNGSVTVGPYRWIMRVENKFGGSPAYVKDVRFFDGEEDVTGIQTLSNSPLKGEDIYNLAGQKLNTMQKGINIVNGKKILK